jgi:phage major head subunit gpT-like protein
MKKILGMLAIMAGILLLTVVPASASQGAAQATGAVTSILGLLIGGLVINASSLAALYKNFRTIYQEAFDQAKPQYDQVATVIPSAAESEVYVWLEFSPTMREWLGDREVMNLKASDWTIKNKNWESTIAVPRNKILFDTYGVFKPLFSLMGGMAKTHPDIIVFKLLNDAFTTKCYDGKNFFDTTHAFGSNKGTGVLNTTNFGIGMAALRRLKKPDGKTPFLTGAEKITLVTGPELQQKAMEICNNQFTAVAGAGMQDNVWKNSATPVMSSQITSATAWFLLADFFGIRPLVFQEARGPEFQAKEDPQSSDHVFKRNEFLYGVDSIDNAGYGLPQLAYGSDGSV